MDKIFKYKAIREQVWLKQFGSNKFTVKCPIIWCRNIITPFSFHVAHNIPKSKGGLLDLNNLFPICKSCNMSMSNHHTIDEWNSIVKNSSPHYTETNNWCKCIIS